MLPLLSHALDQAWRSRTGEALTLADYERTGGIEGAVADSAQRAYDRLTPAQQAAARQVFTRLTATSSDGVDTADRATRAELTEGKSPAEVRDVEAVLEAFAAERLLTLAADTVEISHEVLLTAWPLLRDTWLAETHADRIVRTRLHNVAAEWARHSRDPSYLYSGSLLQAAAETAARIGADPARHPPLSQAERDFLRASEPLPAAGRAPAARLHRLPPGPGHRPRLRSRSLAVRRPPGMLYTNVTSPSPASWSTESEASAPPIPRVSKLAEHRGMAHRPLQRRPATPCSTLLACSPTAVSLLTGQRARTGRSMRWRSARTARPWPAATTARTCGCGTWPPTARSATPSPPHRRGLLGGVQPGRQDPGQRRRRQHRAAVGRGHPPPDRRTPSPATRGRHAVAFSPDGKTLASGGPTMARCGCGMWPPAARSAPP